MKKSSPGPVPIPKAKLEPRDYSQVEPEIRLTLQKIFKKISNRILSKRNPLEKALVPHYVKAVDSVLKDILMVEGKATSISATTTLKTSSGKELTHDQMREFFRKQGEEQNKKVAH